MILIRAFTEKIFVVDNINKQKSRSVKCDPQLVFRCFFYIGTDKIKPESLNREKCSS